MGGCEKPPMMHFIWAPTSDKLHSAALAGVSNKFASRLPGHILRRDTAGIRENQQANMRRRDTAGQKCSTVICANAAFSNVALCESLLSYRKTFGNHCRKSFIFPRHQLPWYDKQIRSKQRLLPAIREPLLQNKFLSIYV